MNFAQMEYEGQMGPSERELLYNIIKEYKPKVVFEIGTWKGGGSTFFISSALYENKKGKLYTFEINQDFFDTAINLYNTKLYHLKNYIDFNFGNSIETIPNVLKTLDNKIDLVFLDGEEDKQENLDQFHMLFPFMNKNSFLCCHDWKMSKQEYLKKDQTFLENFEPYQIIENTITGFGTFKRK